jgi:hypothetical protein
METFLFQNNKGKKPRPVNKSRLIGNSLMVAIPSQVVQDLKLKSGDEMLFDVKD